MNLAIQKPTFFWDALYNCFLSWGILWKSWSENFKASWSANYIPPHPFNLIVFNIDDDDHGDSKLLSTNLTSIVQHAYDNFDDDTRQYASVYILHKINSKNTLFAITQTTKGNARIFSLWYFCKRITQNKSQKRLVPLDYKGNARIFLFNDKCIHSSGQLKTHIRGQSES